MKTKLSIIANVVLFISSALLLIDIAPADFMPQYKRLESAITLLKEKNNILKPQEGVNIDLGNNNGVLDVDSFQVLSSFIQENSPHSATVDWGRVIGVGYSTLSIPVAKSKLEAFRPLYVLLKPNNMSLEMELIPVGEFLDLNKWAKTRRLGTLTYTALSLLTFGFLLQLFSSIGNRKQRSDIEVITDYQI